jgi:hypothetical protein
VGCGSDLGVPTAVHMTKRTIRGKNSPTFGASQSPRHGDSNKSLLRFGSSLLSANMFEEPNFCHFFDRRQRVYRTSELQFIEEEDWQVESKRAPVSSPKAFELHDKSTLAVDTKQAGQFSDKVFAHVGSQPP